MIGQQKQDDNKKDQVQEPVAVDEKDVKAAELEDKVKELDNNWKRALADYQNLVKRSQEEIISVATYGNRTILLKFLELLDHLEEAQKHLNDTGLELIITQFKNVLKNEDVVEIEVLNKIFDPLYHECVEKKFGERDNLVIEVARKGYLYKDKVLRPARVIVEVNK